MRGAAGGECHATLLPGADGSSRRAAARPICREAGDVAFVVALSALPGIGPVTLRAMLEHRSARECWADVLSGTLAVPRSRRRVRDERERLALWRAAAADVDPVELLRHGQARGIHAHVVGDPSYPALLAGEQSAPVVCFTTGGRALVGAGLSGTPSQDAARVAVVGTRSATHYGTEVAADLGAGLSEAGVCVVSGLAAGVDAAAHDGAIASGATPPLAIVGGGVDVVYPARNRRLWARLLSVGTVLSEAPPGAPPERWRFPLRNRLVAAASDLVVVVEAHRTGGAMHTVDAALARGVLVAAVPGSVRSAASEGTNALIADGAAVVRDVDDALALLGLVRAGQIGGPFRAPMPGSQSRSPGGAALLREGAAPPAARQSPTLLDGTDLEAQTLGPGSISGPRPDGLRTADLPRLAEGGVAARILAAFDERATGLETLLARTGLGLGEASLALDHLVASGWVRRNAGAYERSVGAAGCGVP